MDLVKQLEDKKKGCGQEINQNNYINRTILRCSENTEYCPKCKYEITILEQAITEMQKQRQEILEVIDEILFHMKCKNCDCNICQCGKLDFIVDVRVIKEIRAEVDTEQLNQPKTEKENSKHD